MRRDWVASAQLGEVPPIGTWPLDLDPTYEERFQHWWEGEAESRRTWLARRGAAAVGMCSVKLFERMPRSGVDSSRRAYLANVWVDPPHRRRGFGTSLLRRVVDWAAEKPWCGSS